MVFHFHFRDLRDIHGLVFRALPRARWRRHTPTTCWAVGSASDDSGTQTWTVYNGKSANANSYADFSGAGSLKMRYLSGLAVDEVLAQTDSSGNIDWYLTDNLGLVTDVVNTSGTDLDHVVYDPYGNIVTQTNATNGVRFGFAGMEYDSVTWLYYDHARYYDAAIGRFVSQDRKGFAAGDTDLYRYAANAPTDEVDPSGSLAVGGSLLLAATGLSPGDFPQRPGGGDTDPLPPLPPSPIGIGIYPIAGPENNPTEGILIGPGAEVPLFPVIPKPDPGEPNKIGVYGGVIIEVQWFQRFAKFIQRIRH